ncbi:tetratricopeptide repeat protein [Streptomyces sp. NPDC101118]|uniref:tetratricopeptide repeat protein n=1 Tax=Streptomyces sp. NPDC101118 TaxID=3366109 RepID=UPI0038143D4F
MHDTNEQATASRADVGGSAVTTADVAAEGARARALIAAGRYRQARRVAKAALETHGPAPELSLALAVAHVAEDRDDHDDRAEKVFRRALADFPGDPDLLAGYAELCLRTIHADRPARSSRGPALVERLTVLAPGSAQARRVAAVAAAPHHNAGLAHARAVQRHDLRDALATAGARGAAQAARAQAALRPDDARRAVLAASLGELARPWAAPLVPLARSPYGSDLVGAAVLAVLLLNAAALGFPAWALGCLALLARMPRILLAGRLRVARRRGELAAAAHPAIVAPALPGLPPVRLAPRDRLLALASRGVVCSGVAGAVVGTYAAHV